MKKILITGGAGFIASCLADKLARNPDNTIVIVDNLETGSKEKLPRSKHDNVKFIQGDVNKSNDISSVFHAFSFDYVFHYAALVGVQRTLSHPVKVLDDINGIRHILDLSKNTGVKRVLFSSSSEVYGEPVELPQNEVTTPLNSRLPYAVVKNVGEAFLKAYQQEFGLDYTIFRFFNTYGPKQSKDFVVSKFIAAALKGSPLHIHGDGSQTRTFCYVDDNVDACVAAFEKNDYINDVMNVGSDKEITILELAETIRELTGSSSEIEFGPALEEGDMTRRCPDITKMKKVLQRDLLPLEKGIEIILKDTGYIL